MTAPGAAQLVERFPALEQISCIRHLFIRRIPGIDTNAERQIVLPRFAEIHEKIRRDYGLEGPLISAQQVHGNGLAVVTQADTVTPVQAVDGLLTKVPAVTLGIYVADCCAVYIVDPIRKAIALLHSGRKGSELEITRLAIEKMTREFGSKPEDLVVQLSPCIRPPLYEIDFAALVRHQAQESGVKWIYDSGTCTGANTSDYYSYRMEKGKTGRLLALLMLTE